MRLLLFLILLPVSSLLAQLPAAQYIDVVHLYEGSPKEGTILTYEYGKRVILVEEASGEIFAFNWEEVKRVNFRLDRTRENLVVAEAQAATATLAQTPIFPDVEFRPKRNFYHQVSAGASFGQSSLGDNNFGFRTTTIAGGVAYHLVRRLKTISVGVGADLSLMNHRLKERVFALTAFGDLPLSRGAVQPFLRMETGITYPFGAGAGESNEGKVTERSLAPLFHPAIGLEFVGKQAQWNRLTIDLGYRFFTSTFTITDANLDVIERKSNYRRLILRGGYRF
ncbi:MAG: hypothetical protein AAF840_16000 [Bacteroidota bacterium]